MTVTPTLPEMTSARSWIGTDETDDVFSERFDRAYTAAGLSQTWTLDREHRARALADAVLESLRAQLAVMLLNEPSSASAEGNSYSNVQNIVGMEAQIKQFLGVGIGGTQASGGATTLASRRYSHSRHFFGR